MHGSSSGAGIAREQDHRRLAPVALGTNPYYGAHMTDPSQVSDYDVTARSTDICGRVLYDAQGAQLVEEFKRL